jgi:hypothetical protein
MRDGTAEPCARTFVAHAAGALLVMLLLACASAAPAPAPPPPPSPITPAAPPEPLRPRDAVRPVRVTNAFANAVRLGTRTMNGQPGSAYWQQRVEYRIDAELDPATGRVQAEEVVTYHNQSPDTLLTMVFHLYQNVFAQGAQRVRRVPITGGMTIERVEVGGIALRANPQPNAPGYAIDGTIMRLNLPGRLRPGASADVKIAWRFMVPPRGAPRTAHDARDVFVVAQWYPQVAVYDDLRGWHDRPYWSNAEFYLEYADFDVSLTVPETWLVRASGVLENPDEVFTPEIMARLDRARAQDDVVHVVTADDIDAKRTTLREPGGLLNWRFRARQVRDFAFAASNLWVWDAVRAAAPDTILVHALYRPQAESWTRAAEYMRHAVTFHARRWLDYPWPHITAVEGPVGGMEYPMLVFIGAPGSAQDLYAVLSHEIAHQWWPMIVGSNETAHAWQDEGLAQWAEELSVKDFFPDTDAFRDSRDAYLGIAGGDDERPLMREADLYGPGPQYTVATYYKPALLFRALGVVLGENVLHNAMRTYVTRWAFKHPTPFDLFHTIEEAAGRDLDWFWTPWFFDTVVLDHAISSVATEQIPAGERITVVIEDQGDAPMPVPLEVTLESGEHRQLLLPVEPWLQGRMRQRIITDFPSRVMRVEIDPGRQLPDRDPADNVWMRPGL